MTVSNPGSSFPLRGSGRKGALGWPTDERLGSLRDQWFDAPDLPGRKAIAEQMQLQALQTLPYVPLGQVFQLRAYRSDVRDIVGSHLPLFWGVRRGDDHSSEAMRACVFARSGATGCSVDGERTETSSFGYNN